MFQAGDKFNLQAFLKSDFSFVQPGLGSWENTRSAFSESRSPYLGGSPVACGLRVQREPLFPHPFLRQMQAQSAGIIQLHPIRLHQTGRERSYRKHWKAQFHFHERLRLLTRAHWARLWRKPRLWDAAISTRRTLFSGADSWLRCESVHTVSQRGKPSSAPNQLRSQPFLAQMQKSLLLKIIPFGDQIRAAPLSKRTCYYKISRPDWDEMRRSKKNDGLDKGPGSTWGDLQAVNPGDTGPLGFPSFHWTWAEETTLSPSWNYRVFFFLPCQSPVCLTMHPVGFTFFADLSPGSRHAWKGVSVHSQGSILKGQSYVSIAVVKIALEFDG